MPMHALFALTLAAASTTTLPAERIREAVASAVDARLREAGSSARIVAIDGLRDQVLPAGRSSIAVDAVTGRWPRARAGVPVRLMVDGHPVRTVTAWVSLGDVRKVLTYAEAGAARMPVAALRLMPAEVDMTCCASSPVLDPAGIAALRLRRGVRAGEPVLASDFEPLPAVAAHAQVEIEVEQGAVRLRTQGIALIDGGLGERVPVRPEGAQSVVAARVIATGKVRIDDASPQ